MRRVDERKARLRKQWRGRGPDASRFWEVAANRRSGRRNVRIELNGGTCNRRRLRVHDICVIASLYHWDGRTEAEFVVSLT